MVTREYWPTCGARRTRQRQNMCAERIEKVSTPRLDRSFLHPKTSRVAQAGARARRPNPRLLVDRRTLRHSAAPCRLYTWACCVRCVPPRMDDMYEDPRHDHVYTLVSAPRLDDYTFTRTHYTCTRCAYARTALQSPPLRPASRFPYPTTPLIPCAALHQLHFRRAARPCARHASAIGSIHHARPNRASVRDGR